MTILWWLITPGRWDRAFPSAIWPVLGFVFLPWTTLIWVIVAPNGSADGSDWFLLALGLLMDVFSSGFVGYGRKGWAMRY